MLTFALFEALTLAWSAGTSRNIFQFYIKYVRAHKALFEFLIFMIQALVNIFSGIVGSLTPTKLLAAGIGASAILFLLNFLGGY